MTRSQAGRLRVTRVWLLLTLGLVVVLVVTVGVVKLRSVESDIAAESVVTASSTDPIFSARDVVTARSATSPGAGWKSSGETTGAWVQLNWAAEHVVRKVVVVRDPATQPGVRAGFLTFSDGSHLQLAFAAGSRSVTLSIDARNVDEMRFTASEVDPGATDVSIAEILVFTGTSREDGTTERHANENIAPSAAVRASSDGAVISAEGLVDGGSGSDVGIVWSSPGGATQTIDLSWDEPHEIAGIQLVGSNSGSSVVASVDVAFDDGSTLLMGAVRNQDQTATTVSLMPRVSRSLQLTLHSADAGAVSISEVRVYTPGGVVDDVWPPGAVPGAAELEPGCSDLDRARSGDSGLVVSCPVSTGGVAGTAILQVDGAEPYDLISATVIRPDRAGEEGPETTSEPVGLDSVFLDVDLTDVPFGPFTVEVKATGAGVDDDVVYLQLFHIVGERVAQDATVGYAPRGRQLVFDEEFDSLVSVSRTGVDAEYAGAKPTWSGPEDFGSAEFGDPTTNPDSVRVVDGGFLRLGVAPQGRASGSEAGSGKFSAGMLASAAQGGSGFSAQYGYFEARMLAPAARGTWPAFWLLPSDNLIQETPVVAEIDAIELYGHDPKVGCHTTHHYENGVDSGGLVNCGQRFASDALALAWHTYGVSVTPTSIQFFIDGVLVGSAPQVGGGGAPMFFLVNLALGGGWPVDLSAVQSRAALYVDYVRVYV